MTKRQGTTSHDALDALFVDGELPEGLDAQSLHQALARDEHAANHYNKLALTARALEGKEDERSELEQRFAEDSFLGALDELLEREHGPLQDNVIQVSFIQRARPYIALAATVAIVFGAYSMLAPTDPAPAEDDGFQARTAVNTAPYATPDAISAPTLELFCLEKARGGEVTFRDQSNAAFGVLDCPLDAELKLAYSNASSELEYVAVFGVDHRGELLWYGPSPASPDAVRVRHALEPTPLGESIRLNVNHARGEVRVHAIFSTRPIDYDKLEEVIDAQQRAQLFEASTLTLPDGMRGVSTSSSFDITGVNR